MYGKGQLRQKSVYIYLFNLHVHAIEHKKCEITQIPQRTKIHTSLITYHMYIYINAAIQKSLQFTKKSALWGNPDSNPNSKSSILD